MIALALCALLQAGAARAALAEVELSGPLQSFEVELADAGSAELAPEPPLEPGERRTFLLAVPLPAAELFAGAWPDFLRSQLERAGARLSGLRPPRELDGVDAGLLARERPALAPRGEHMSWSALFVLGAAFAITLSQRRRPWTASAIALAACGSVLALAHPGARAALAGVTLLEARLDAAGTGEPWLRVRAQRNALESEDLGRARIELDPPLSPLRCTTRGNPPRVRLEARGATLYELAAFDPGARRLAREVNAFAGFEEAWLREGDGPWQALGAWPLGEALPETRPGQPPGWLVPALPMGTSIFLGRLADPPGGAQRAHAPATPTWVRGVGL